MAKQRAQQNPTHYNSQRQQLLISPQPSSCSSEIGRIFAGRESNDIVDTNKISDIHLVDLRMERRDKRDCGQVNKDHSNPRNDQEESTNFDTSTPKKTKTDFYRQLTNFELKRPNVSSINPSLMSTRAKNSLYSKLNSATTFKSVSIGQKPINVLSKSLSGQDSSKKSPNSKTFPLLESPKRVPEPLKLKSPKPLKLKSPKPLKLKSPEPLKLKSPEPTTIKSPEPTTSKISIEPSNLKPNSPGSTPDSDYSPRSPPPESFIPFNEGSPEKRLYNANKINDFDLESDTDLDKDEEEPSWKSTLANAAKDMKTKKSLEELLGLDSNGNTVAGSPI